MSSLIAIMTWYDLAPVRILDQLFQDSLIRFSTRNNISSSVQYTALIDIDDESLGVIGQWPWPRYRIANLLNIVAKKGPDVFYAPPAAIALDILFSEPDRSSLSSIQETFQKEFNLDISFEGVPFGMEDNDGYLGNIFSSTKAVGSYFMYFDMESKEECELPSLQVTGDKTVITPPHAYGVLCNTPRVQSGILFGGYVNALLDDDGILRSLPLLAVYNDNWYPSLALAALMRAQRTNTIHIETDIFGPVLVIGEAKLPVDKTGRVVVNFLGAQGTVPTLSAVQVFSGEENLALLSERIVFLGSSAIGLHDFYRTPVGLEFPGFEVHGTLVENAISGKTLRIPVWRQEYIVGVTLFFGLCMSMFFVFLRPVRAIVAVVLVAGIPFFISLWLFFTHGVQLPVAGPILTMFFLSFLFSLQLYADERKKSLCQHRQIIQSQKAFLEAMSAVIETSNFEFDGDGRRIQEYIRVLATRLAEKEVYPELTPKYIEILFHCAPLHDIGKVGISDVILTKPGPLTSGEFKIVKEHAVLGKTIIDKAGNEAVNKDFFQMVGELVYTHHERWDGQGYPQGLAGTAIPLSGRLMALVDVYDALVHSQPYKKAFSHEEARNIILEGRGTQFDPLVTDAFFEVEKEFFKISKQLVKNST